MNLPLLREFVEAHGIASREEEPRAVAERELSAFGATRTDRLGNLILHREGSGPKVMLAAHLDEIGFIVRYVDEEGFLFLQPLGGFDPRMMNAQRVRVTTEGGSIPGTLNYGTKPKHLLTPEEEGARQKVPSFFVDTGLGRRAIEKVRLGDMVTMDRPLTEMGDLLVAKAMDDRVSVFVMIEAIRAALAGPGGIGADLYAVATVQEEIGLRGAAAAGSAIAPDIVIAIDITLANDIPGIPKSDWTTRLGGGAAIKIMDSSLVCDPGLVRRFRTLAEENDIRHQMEILSAGGTDAGAIQRLHGGIPSFTLSIPTRYVHTVNETVHRSDVEASISLLARFLERPLA